MFIILILRNAKKKPDLGKSLKWPDPPRILAHLGPLFYQAFQRWRAFTVLSKYPKDTWAELHLKITALELLRGKRAIWGIERYIKKVLSYCTQIILYVY